MQLEAKIMTSRTSGSGMHDCSSSSRERSMSTCLKRLSQQTCGVGAVVPDDTVGEWDVFPKSTLRSYHDTFMQVPDGAAFQDQYP
jgi:hypothetical protein